VNARLRLQDGPGRQFQQQHPKLRINLDVGDRLVSLDEGQFLKAWVRSSPAAPVFRFINPPSHSRAVRGQNHCRSQARTIITKFQRAAMKTSYPLDQAQP
jgi:hypothetical protein